jgi:hypothetical protein
VLLLQHCLLAGPFTDVPEVIFNIWKNLLKHGLASVCDAFFAMLGVGMIDAIEMVAACGEFRRVLRACLGLRGALSIFRNCVG